MSFIRLLTWAMIIVCRLKISWCFSAGDETVFRTDYCGVKCLGNPHSMCLVKNIKPECSSFELFEIRPDSKDTEMIKTLVNGHNGVRNRIAERMNIPNMLELHWDSKLARMANNFLHRCKDRISDPCTLTEVVFDEVGTINEFFKFNHSAAYIVQNLYHEMGTFFPYKFLERVIRHWYFEKDGMRAPTKVTEKTKRLMGENNFTHFAYPYIYRLGCGMARFQNAFQIVCNYYPFYRTVTNTMYFEVGEPVSSCPARFPLKDELFTSLCTDDSSEFLGSCPRIQNMTFTFISILSIVSTFLILELLGAL